MKELTFLFMHRHNSVRRKDHAELFCLPQTLLIAIPIIVLSLAGCTTLSSSEYITKDSQIETSPIEIDSLRKVSDGYRAPERMNAIHHDSFSSLPDQKRMFHAFAHQLRENHRQSFEILSKNSVLEEIIGSLVVEFDLLKKVYEQVSGVRGALIQDFQQAKLEFGEIADSNTSLRQKLIQIQNKIFSVEVRTERIIVECEILTERLSVTTDQIRKSKTLKNFFLGTRNRFENKLSLLETERNSIIKQSMLLGTCVNELEQQIADLNEAQRKLVSKLNKRVTRYLDEFEQALTVTGLNVPALLTELDMPPTDHNRVRGSGGPFIAYSPSPSKGSSGFSQMDRIDSMLADLEDHVGRWEVFHQLLRQMPLSFPVEKFKITSKFGKRRDPINGKTAMHYGVDMNSDSRPPVLATAPGIVTIAGWKPYYGGMVEINHGFGIYSRYGHLRKVLVKKGQKVDFHQMIGRMGSTGRSTGPHVHYEITVNGIPQDPLKFIDTGRYSFKRISKSIKKYITSPAS